MDPREVRNLNRRLRLKHFELLRELGEAKNLADAAQSMNIAQSTATKLLQEVENALGTKLFKRDRGGIKPNEAGELAIRRARLVLSDVKALNTELEVVSRGGARFVRIGVFPVATTHMLPGLIAELRLASPGFRFSVEEGDEVSLSKKLAEGDLDFVIGRLDAPIAQKGFKHHVLYHERVVVVCGPHNPLTEIDAHDIAAALATADWILPTVSTGGSQLVTRYLVDAGHAPPSVVIESISVLSTLNLMESAHYAAILPQSVCDKFEPFGLLHRLPVNLVSGALPVGLVYRKDFETLEITQEFLKISQRVSETVDVQQHERKRPGNPLPQQ